MDSVGEEIEAVSSESSGAAAGRGQAAAGEIA
jgi:hypothetical protein